MYGGVFLTTYICDVLVHMYMHTIDWENFVVKKVMWDKSSIHFKQKV